MPRYCINATVLEFKARKELNYVQAEVNLWKEN
jgi:peptide methionine sulfoxide reductase MsrB